MRCIIVDDEQPARELIKNYLEDFPEIEIINECTDGFSALKEINQLKPDLIFLDIQMPKLTGIELLEVLDHKSLVIFTTAYDEYAIKAFEINAIDYLLKPFSKTRFAEAINKLNDRMKNLKQESKKINEFVDQTKQSIKELNRVVVKTGSKIKVIPVETINFIEAYDDYVNIYTNDGKFIKQATMKYFESHLNEDKFSRIHRSYIVNIQNIIQLELYEKDTYLVVLKSGEKLKTSRSGYKNLKQKLNF
ncbi:MAG: LytTR family transcriptional regulator DNA-binding domain-containing protein [Bacteroidales bacterium]|nr:LytTR family transcriptional regulator DNA-binding domain-containing protein [Bacteroidales bacterium]